MYWLVKYLDLVTLTYILHSSDFDTFYIDVRYHLKYKPTTTKPCIALHYIVPDWQEPWPIFDTFYVDVR